MDNREPGPAWRAIETIENPVMSAHCAAGVSSASCLSCTSSSTWVASAAVEHPQSSSAGNGWRPGRGHDEEDRDLISDAACTVGSPSATPKATAAVATAGQQRGEGCELRLGRVQPHAV